MTLADEMSVLIPTRGRPRNMIDSIIAMRKTKTQAKVYYIVSIDDPVLGGYEDFFEGFVDPDEDIFLKYVQVSIRGCMPPTNAALFNTSFAILGSKYTAWMGDDHRPRTEGWDAIYAAELDELGDAGVVYGNDLGQGVNLPTQVAMTSNIPRALGYFCPTTIRHLYCDNIWLDWGKGLGRIKYLPEVVVEHMHPGFGKAKADAGYAFSGSSDVDASDREAYEAYRAHQYYQDIEKLWSLL